MPFLCERTQLASERGTSLRVQFASAICERNLPAAQDAPTNYERNFQARSERNLLAKSTSLVQFAGAICKSSTQV